MGLFSHAYMSELVPESGTVVSCQHVQKCKFLVLLQNVEDVETADEETADEHMASDDETQPPESPEQVQNECIKTVFNLFFVYN